MEEKNGGYTAEEIRELAEILQASKGTVFFTGAGVSTESGIPDFRSADGVYNMKLHRSVSPEEMVSHSYYRDHPEEFFAFYREKLIYPEAEPNACHRAIARLEETGSCIGVVTQNIDGLHQKAGSHAVHELHGSVLRNYCEICAKRYDVSFILESSGVPHCDRPGCKGRVRPDVVLYEESLDDDVIRAAVNAIRSADVMVVGGTSLMVYPAAGLINYFHGRKLILINRTQTPYDNKADLVVRGSIGEVMSEVMSIIDESEQ